MDLIVEFTARVVVQSTWIRLDENFRSNSKSASGNTKEILNGFKMAFLLNLKKNC